jgi:hypothetical protein
MNFQSWFSYSSSSSTHSTLNKVIWCYMYVQPPQSSYPQYANYSSIHRIELSQWSPIKTNLAHHAIRLLLCLVTHYPVTIWPAVSLQVSP